MNSRQCAICVLIALLVLISGCTTKRKPALIPGYADRGIRLIAVLPVKATEADKRLAKLMREKVLATLYFKGYPKIPFEVIDDMLIKAPPGTMDDTGYIAPQAVRQLLSVDAVLYLGLDESGTATTYLYASSILSATFELRDGRSGDTIWKSQVKEVERSFDITKQRLERTVYQVLEPALQAMVDKALQGLPDGPDVVK